MQLKILWITGSRVVGGAERATLELAHRFLKRDHQFEVLCPKVGALTDEIERQSIKAHRGAVGGQLNAAEPLVVYRALRELGPDIAIVSNVDDWWWCCLAPRPRSARLVLVRHMSLPLPWALRRLAAWRANAIVAVSQAAQASLIAKGAIGAEQVHVIYNPVRLPPRDAPPTREERATARTALKLPAEGRWVGFLGGMSVPKGLLDVASAVHHANLTLGNTHLLACGPSNRAENEGILARIRELGLKDRFHYLGSIDRVTDFLTAVDVLAVATRSNLSEGLSMALLEAMACGTPALAYATGGTPEALGADRITGRLVNPDDVQALALALAEILSQPAEAGRMALNALRRVRERFDPGRAADRYEQLFASLAADAV